MLKSEVVEAVRSGKFHIYPIRTIDEGMEILTGVKAGAPVVVCERRGGKMRARRQNSKGEEEIIEEWKPSRLERMRRGNESKKMEHQRKHFSDDF